MHIRYFLQFCVFVDMFYQTLCALLDFILSTCVFLSFSGFVIRFLCVLLVLELIDVFLTDCPLSWEFVVVSLSGH